MAVLCGSSCCSLAAGSFVPVQIKCGMTKCSGTMLPQQCTSSLQDSVVNTPTFKLLYISGKNIRNSGSCRSRTANSVAAWQPTCLQSKAVIAKPGYGGRRRQQQQQQEKRQAWRIEAGLKETELTEQQWGPPIRLGTAQLPGDVDLPRLQNLLYQWGSNLTQNANLPLPVPLKVDKVEGGVRIGYIRVSDGKVEDLVHIDVLVTPATEVSKAMFQALRNGKMKNAVPPGEPMIMQSLLAALKKAVALSRP